MSSDASSSCSFDSFSLASDSVPSTAPSSVRSASPPPSQTPYRSQSQKEATVHIPLRLPGPPEGSPMDVDWDALELDDALTGLPRAFVWDKLRQLGPTLHHSALLTTLHLPGSAAGLSHVAVTPPPKELPVPTHVLAIKTLDATKTLLVPVHGLRWATTCANLACLASALPSPCPSFTTADSDDASEATDDKVYLPLLSVSLPSSSSFPLLQGFLHGLITPSQLLAALVPPPPLTPSSLSHLLNPTPMTLSSAQTSLSHVPTATLLERVRLVHGLWGDAVALGFGDEGFWQTLERAWGILVGALAEKEARRRQDILGEVLGTMRDGLETSA